MSCAVWPGSGVINGISFFTVCYFFSYFIMIITRFHREGKMEEILTIIGGVWFSGSIVRLVVSFVLLAVGLVSIFLVSSEG